MHADSSYVRWMWLLASIVVLWTSRRAEGDIWLSTRCPDGVEVKETSASMAPNIDVANADDAGVTLNIEAPGLLLAGEKAAAGSYVRLSWPGASWIGEIGAPAIPVIRRLLQAPPGSKPTLEVSEGQPRVVTSPNAGMELRVMPVQPPVVKLPGAAEAADFHLDALAYANDSMVPAVRAVLTPAGTVRDHMLYLLEVRPVAYNAARRSLTIWPSLTVEVRFTPATPQANRPAAPDVQRLVVNPLPVRQTDASQMDYLVIVASSYEAALVPFVQAKTAQGYNVATWAAAPGASSTAIRSYIQSRYDNLETRPEYVLLVGDTDRIPSWTGGGEDSPATDLPYACMDGSSDWMPDIAIGRFPVRSVSQLADVVAKTLYLEDGPLSDPGYLSRAVFMASCDNYTVSEGTHNWTIEHYMDPNNFESDKLYCHTYNATTQQVRNAFNDGRIYGIYSGHGDVHEWADGPPFSTSDVHGLFNEDMYSFVCSFACLTGTYTDVECLMETWLLAPAKGAAAAWGSSVLSYWTEDDVLQRKLFIALYDDYLREVGRSINMARLRYAEQMGTGDFTRRYFEMYNLMGDPSLAIPEAEAALRVSPGNDFVSEGPEGGPFAPASAVYTLRNVADYAINYEVTHLPAVDWVTLSGATGGQLGAGSEAVVVVSVNNQATSLEIGMHHDTLYFTNLTDQVGDTARSVVLQVGRYVFNATDVPKPITDNATMTSELEVAEHFCVGDINVSVDISHSYVGDLVVSLTSPSDTTVILHNRSGGGASDIHVTFDDEQFPPDGPGMLADFDHTTPVGTWTLSVSDQSGGDQGNLNEWALRVLPAGEFCPPVAFDKSTGTPMNTAIDITLEAENFTTGLLEFIIVALPDHGVLRDPAGGKITFVPYALAAYGRIVRYVPGINYHGNDGFAFKGYDGQDSNAAAVSIEIGGPQAVHVFPMDVNPGWTTEGAWAFGHPLGGGSHQGDPTAGFTGENVYGYNLAGDYADNMPPRYLTTTSLDCAGMTGTSLRFKRWLGVESSQWDHANIEVSNDGASWTTVWEHAGDSIDEATWTTQAFDIAATADGHATVVVRWGLGPTDGSVTYPGWNIDDVEIWGTPPANMLGDCDADSDVDLFDCAVFVGCVSGPGGGVAGGCDALDLDNDDDVDFVDFSIFQLAFTGAP